VSPDYLERIAAIHRELSLASAAIALPLQKEADERSLVRIEPHLGATRDGLWLDPGAASAWSGMHRAATRDGIALELISGFRSVERQRQIIAGHLARGRPLDDILRWIAPPGHSEHHTGEAVDIGTPGSPELEETFENTRAFAWLSRHAAEFGFTMSYPRENTFGVGYEPWHWRFRR